MSIESINEQLLRSVGVGIALFDESGRVLEFCNDVFQSWFPDASNGVGLHSLFPELDVAAMMSELQSSGQFSQEFSVRKKRRTLVLDQRFTRTEISGQQILVLECQNITRIRELESMIDSYSRMVEKNTREIQREKVQVESLLLNVMPRAAYEEFKEFGFVTPQRFDNATVMVLEFVEFDDRVANLQPATLISELNEIYGAFDRIGEQLGCERIRTSGDAYRCMAGLDDPDADHLSIIAGAAIRFKRFLQRRNQNSDHQWLCRMGIGTGELVGSIVGANKYVFDVFGDAITQARKAIQVADVNEILIDVSRVTALPSTLRVGQAGLMAAREQGWVALEEPVQE